MRQTVLPDYPGYIVFEDGRIFSTSTKRVFLKPGITPDGYEQVFLITPLAKNGYRHSIKVHRIIAKAFVDNPNGYTEVNHIDGNKLNNHASNLEWCTRSHNITQCYALGFRSSKGACNGNYKNGKYVSV